MHVRSHVLDDLGTHGRCALILPKGYIQKRVQGVWTRPRCCLGKHIHHILWFILEIVMVLLIHMK